MIRKYILAIKRIEPVIIELERPEYNPNNEGISIYMDNLNNSNNILSVSSNNQDTILAVRR